MINPIETKINIQGIKSRYTFIHVTDVHLTLCSEDDSDRIKTSAINRSNVFATRDNIPSSDRFESYFEYAKNANADLILLTGDIADFPTKSNINKIEKTIMKSKVPTLYTLGNHDWSFEWDYQTTETKQAYKPMYNDLTSDFQVKEFEDLQVIALNNSENQVTKDQLDKTYELLRNNKPTIIAMHIPIYIGTLLEDTLRVWKKPIVLGPGGMNPSEITTEYYNLLRDEKNNVQAIIAGHLHFDHIDYFLPNRPQIITSHATEGHFRVIKIC